MRFYYPLAFALTLSTLNAASQMQVSLEPRHHKVFDNAWVRILDVHVPPGDTTFFHKHSTPSVFLVLTNTRTGSEVLIEPEKAHFTDGNIFFEGFYDKPRVHRVWNSDTTEFHVIDMELPATTHQAIDPPLNIPGFKLLFDEKPVRGYRLSLGPAKSIRLEKRVAPVVLIAVSDMEEVTAGPAESGAAKTFRKKGDYLFISPGTPIVFSNSGPTPAAFAVFELK